MQPIDDLLRDAGLTAASDQLEASMVRMGRGLAALYHAFLAGGLSDAHALYLTAEYLRGFQSGTVPEAAAPTAPNQTPTD